LNNSGSYLFSETQTDFTLAVSHLKRWNYTINVIVDRVGHGEGCALSSYMDVTATNMMVILPNSRAWLSASVNVICKK